MSTRRMNLNKKCFFVLSGVTNPMGKHLAVEMCDRFQEGSFVLLIDISDEALQETRKDIEALERGIKVLSFNLKDWLQADSNLFHNLLNTVLSQHQAKDGDEISKQFEMAFILHNEGNAATHMLMEPQEASTWKMFVHENLYAPMALNQEFINSQMLKGLPKLAINIKSSLLVQPLIYSSLRCSCIKARDMYFRSMAAEEFHNDVNVLSYAPGILETHKPSYDCNNNMIDVPDVIGEDKKLLKLPRVEPQQSALKLINILEEISFISGHDVDYYDTYVL